MAPTTAARKAASLDRSVPRRDRRQGHRQQSGGWQTVSNAWWAGGENANCECGMRNACSLGRENVNCECGMRNACSLGRENVNCECGMRNACLLVECGMRMRNAECECDPRTNPDTMKCGMRMRNAECGTRVQNAGRDCRLRDWTARMRGVTAECVTGLRECGA